MSTTKHLWNDIAYAGCLAVLLIGTGRAAIHEPLGLALWCVTVAWLCLPLMLLDSRFFASAFLTVASLVTIAAGFFAGIIPAVIVAAVAFSLMGNVWLLIALRIPASFGIGITMVITGLAFTWPIWAATLITQVNIEPWLQWVINLSPAFALNGAIAPEDPLTHRPLAYRLMNLGQDVTYELPGSAWPCVLLHAAAGIAGMLARRWTRVVRAADAKPR